MAEGNILSNICDLFKNLLYNNTSHIDNLYNAFLALYSPVTLTVIVCKRAGWTFAQYLLLC